MTYNALQPPFPEHKPEDQPARQAAVENELKFHPRASMCGDQNYMMSTTRPRCARSCGRRSTSPRRWTRSSGRSSRTTTTLRLRRRRASTRRRPGRASIRREIFDADAATNAPSESMEKSFERLEAQLLRHAEFRPPRSRHLRRGRRPGDHGVDAAHYFRHYKLYKAIFTKRRSDVFSQAPRWPRRRVPTFVAHRCVSKWTCPRMHRHRRRDRRRRRGVRHVLCRRRVRVSAGRAGSRGGRRGEGGRGPRWCRRSTGGGIQAGPAFLRRPGLPPRRSAGGCARRRCAHFRVDARRAARSRPCELGLGIDFDRIVAFAARRCGRPAGLAASRAAVESHGSRRAQARLLQRRRGIVAKAWLDA